VPVYHIIYSIGWLIALLPLRVMYIFSDMLAFLVFHFSMYRKSVVLENLRNSFPDKPENEIRKGARRFYRQFADQVMESFKMLHLNEEQILRRVNYTNPELLEELLASGRSVITVTAHYGTWEWLVSLPLITEYKVLIVYKPPSNENSHFVYKIFQGKYGGVSVELQHLPRTLIEFRKRQEPTVTFLVNDQRPVREQISNRITFLNQLTPIHNGLDRLARKFGQAVLFVQVSRRTRGFYDVTFNFLPEITEETLPDGITESYMRMLEKNIRQEPALWLWTHRRWKLREPAAHSHSGHPG
jgi:KDO2-lipid IV(A) lauroyltransferase